uniref:Uncharacterized protein n=1 Tax=Plectus sambesii TaxID=2011161 RepID=A0A914VY03_9BILA
MLLRNSFVVVAFLATTVTAYSDADYVTNLFGYLIIGLAINGLMAAIGYYKFDFPKVGVILIMLFGCWGCCCACAIDLRSTTGPQTRQQRDRIIVQKQPLPRANPTVVIQARVVGQYAETQLNVTAPLLNVDSAQFDDLPPSNDGAVGAASFEKS